MTNGGLVLVGAGAFLLLASWGMRRRVREKHPNGLIGKAIDDLPLLRYRFNIRLGVACLVIGTSFLVADAMRG